MKATGRSRRFSPSSEATWCLRFGSQIRAMVRQAQRATPTSTSSRCTSGRACHSIDDGFHVDIMRTALTAVIDKGFHVLTDTLTVHGRHMFTGAAAYDGLKGHPTPRTCGAELMKQARPRSIVTHICPKLRGKGTRLCLKQPSAHVWTDVLGDLDNVPKIWTCLPVQDGYAELWERLHTLVMFSMTGVSMSLYPSWEFGEENTCESLAEDLRKAAIEFPYALTTLVPTRRSPNGYEIGWHYQMVTSRTHTPQSPPRPLMHLSP